MFGNAIECKRCHYLTCIDCGERAHFPLDCNDIEEFEGELRQIKEEQDKMLSVIKFVVDEEEAILVYLMKFTKTFSPKFLNVMNFISINEAMIRRKLFSYIKIDDVKNSILKKFKNSPNDAWIQGINDFRDLIIEYNRILSRRTPISNIFKDLFNDYNQRFGLFPINIDVPITIFSDESQKFYFLTHFNYLNKRGNVLMRNANKDYDDVRLDIKTIYGLHINPNQPISFKKKCPKCGRYISKNEGCNHMKCICNFEFCWICLQNYKKHDNSKCKHVAGKLFEPNSDYASFVKSINVSCKNDIGSLLNLDSPVNNLDIYKLEHMDAFENEPYEENA